MSTSTVKPAAELTWEPPGPGSWSLAADHYSRPVTKAYEVFPPVWESASTAYMQDIGLPIRQARMALVNGLPYMSIMPDGGGGSKQPPGWVLKLAVRLMPSMRRAEAKLRRTFAERPWNEGIRRWYERDRAAAIERMTALTRVDLDSLDDDPLARHMEFCYREVMDSVHQHLSMHAHDMLAPALFAVRMIDWGFEAKQAFALLAGASPASTGVSEELRALRQLIDGRRVESIEEIRALGDDVSAALDLFLEQHGWRILDGYDVDSPCLVEMPSLVVALATGPIAPYRNADHEAAAEAARQRVPEEMRGEFDRMLAEARAAYGLRDDNSGILCAWPSGLLRRAMLEAGKRLAQQGQIADATLAIEASPDELGAALRGQAPLENDLLTSRAAYRRSIRTADAPRTLGPPEAPPPTNLPGALGLAMRGFAVLRVGEAPTTEAMHGLGIGAEPYEGRARLVTGGGDGLDSFEAGDVLVAPMTSPSYNVLLAMAGAVVTEEGDAMSHAAIMARELNLPAVIGAPGAATAIHDGDRVQVDPANGTVRVISRATNLAETVASR